MNGNPSPAAHLYFDMTITYYDENAGHFCESTFSLDLGGIRGRFLAHMPAGGKVLDAGCGSARDALAFKQAGYTVTAFDACSPMVEIASKNLGQPVLHMRFEDVHFREEFDGIWACASLLHVAKDSLPHVLALLRNALKPGGALYVSFKYGVQDRIKSDGRYFVDLNEPGLNALLAQCSGLTLQEEWVTRDHRPARASEEWLNAILIKGADAK